MADQLVDNPLVYALVRQRGNKTVPKDVVALEHRPFRAGLSHAVVRADWPLASLHEQTPHEMVGAQGLPRPSAQFISALANKGVDQRIIDELVGHQTDAMRTAIPPPVPPNGRRCDQAGVG